MAGLHELSGGEDPARRRADHRGRIREIAMIFQDANLLPWRTLEKNIRLPFELKRIAAGPRRASSSFWSAWG